MTSWKNANCIDTLAAAYAEAGNFEKAIQWQTKVVGMVSGTRKVGFQKSLDLYRAGKPFRQ